MQHNYFKELEVFESQMKFSAIDFVRWHEEEMAFLSIAKRKEPGDLTLKVSYVEAIQNYVAIECVFHFTFYLHGSFMRSEKYQAARGKIGNIDCFLTVTPHDFAMNIATDVFKRSKQEAVDRELRVVAAQRERAAQRVDDVERLLGIKGRWQQSDVEYQEILKYIGNKKFVRIVEELQGLVVSRLMELDKANLAGSGT